LVFLEISGKLRESLKFQNLIKVGVRANACE
jgi:hypothetical protein